MQKEYDELQIQYSQNKIQIATWKASIQDLEDFVEIKDTEIRKLLEQLKERD